MGEKYIICFATACPRKVQDAIMKFGGMVTSSIKEVGIPDYSVQCYYPKNDASLDAIRILIDNLPLKTDITYIFSDVDGYIYARPSFLRSFSPSERMNYDIKCQNSLSAAEYKLNRHIYAGSENVMLTYSPSYPDTVLMQIVVKVSDYYRSAGLPELKYGSHKSDDLITHRGKVDDHYGKPVYIGVSSENIVLQSKICPAVAKSWSTESFSKKNVCTRLCPLSNHFLAKDEPARKCPSSTSTRPVARKKARGSSIPTF